VDTDADTKGVDAKDAKDTNDAKDAKDAKDTKDTKDTKDSKDPKDFKDSKDYKDYKDSKDSKDSKDAKNVDMVHQGVKIEDQLPTVEECITSKTTLELHSTKNKLQQMSCKLLQLSAAHPTLHSSMQLRIKNENFLFGDSDLARSFFLRRLQTSCEHERAAAELQCSC
jgi:hypothetical protein